MESRGDTAADRPARRTSPPRRGATDSGPCRRWGGGRTAGRTFRRSTGSLNRCSGSRPSKAILVVEVLQDPQRLGGGRRPLQHGLPPEHPQSRCASSRRAGTPAGRRSTARRRCGRTPASRRRRAPAAGRPRPSAALPGPGGDRLDRAMRRFQRTKLKDSSRHVTSSSWNFANGSAGPASRAAERGLAQRLPK